MTNALTFSLSFEFLPLWLKQLQQEKQNFPVTVKFDHLSRFYGGHFCYLTYLMGIRKFIYFYFVVVRT